MSKGSILWMFTILLSVGIFIYFEFPLHDEGVVFKDEKFSLHVPSQNEAQNSLTTDTIDHFFEKISKVDIELQMKTKLPTENKDSLKLIYESFLKNQIVKFKSAEIRGINRIASEVFKTLETKISKSIPTDFQIVKILPNIYGANVFFTRNKTIFLTEDFFSLTYEERKKTFVHELSHILSRYVTDYKEILYPTIFFKKNHFVFQSHFLQTLLNPDGANSYWFFSYNNGHFFQNCLNIETESFPMLLKKDKESESNYLSQVDFVLQGVDTLRGGTTGYINIGSTEVYNDFFLKQYGITYTIHPDEIIAELFVQWLLDAQAVRDSSGLKRKTFEAFDACLKIFDIN